MQFCLEGLGTPYSQQGGSDGTHTAVATIALAFVAFFLMHDVGALMLAALV